MKLNNLPLSFNKLDSHKMTVPKNFGCQNPPEQWLPESSVLRAYNGLCEKKENVSKEELFEFLKASNIRREDLYEDIAKTLQDEDGTIKNQTFEFLKSFQGKRHLIWDSQKIFSEAKEDDQINYKALKLADKLMAPEKGFSYTAPQHYSVVLKNIKNKAGKFDDKALTFFLKHSDEFNKTFERSASYVFKILKNEDGEFLYAAFDYADKKLEEGEKLSDIMSDIYKAKDTRGNFSYDLKNLNDDIEKSFSPMQSSKVKSIASTFTSEQKNERDDFVAFAKSVKEDEKFDSALTVIEELMSEKEDKTGLKYDLESFSFVKNFLVSYYGAEKNALTILKKINKPFIQYTEKEIKTLKDLIRYVVPENQEPFLEGSIYKEGKNKGQFISDNLEKYLDIYYKNNQVIGFEVVKKLAACLALEEDDKALDVFHKLYTISWKSDENYGIEQKLDKDTLNMILDFTCLQIDGKPTRKCYEGRLDSLNKLFTMRLPMSSKEAFENFMFLGEIDIIEKLEKINFEELGIKTGQISQGVFKSASEKDLLNFKDFLKDYLKDKDPKSVNINLNPNIRSTIELSTGRDWDKTKLFYDIKKGEPTTEQNECKWQKRIKRTEKNYKNNIVSELRYIIKQEDYCDYEVFESQTIKKYDKNNNLLYTEVTNKSSIDGVFNIKRTYPDGKEDVICNAFKLPDGSEVIEKNMESFDGTKSHYRYEDDPEGNRIIDYKIVDKNGRKLLNQSVTFEVLDENHFVTTRNNKKFDIKVKDDKILVENQKTNDTVEIDVENFTKSNKDLLLPLLKQFPGDELFAMKKLDLKAFYMNDTVGNAAYNPKEETIAFRDNYKILDVALHEWGHGKDELAFKEINEKISEDKKLREIYNEEKSAFREHFSDAQLSHIGYFSADCHYLGSENAIKEGVAETNTLLSSYPKNETQAIRSHYWQQYFPKTIVYLAGLLN